jgi:hypothetical protein
MIYYASQQYINYIMMVSFIVGGNPIFNDTNGASWNPVQASCTRYNIVVCKCLVAGRWFSLDTPVSSNNKTDHHDIIDILLTGVIYHNPPFPQVRKNRL